MFRRSIGFVFAVLLTASGFAQSTSHGKALLDGVNNAMYSAKSLSVVFTSQTISGARGDYSVDLAKPGKARIETPHVLIIADGTTITTYSKDRQTFCKSPQTDADLLDSFQGDALTLWKPFFESGGIEGVYAAGGMGTKVRKNMSLLVLQLQMNMDATKTLTLYLDPQDSLPRQAEYESEALGNGETVVVDTKSLTVGVEPKPGLFDFTAPEGAREVSADQFYAERWYIDLESAKQVAARTNKRILVFFYNHANKVSNKVEQMTTSQDFKNLSNRFVFVRLDMPRSKQYVTQYKVTMTPSFVFLDKDGKLLSKIGGSQTIAQLQTAAGNVP